MYFDKLENYIILFIIENYKHVAIIKFDIEIFKTENIDYTSDIEMFVPVESIIRHNDNIHILFDNNGQRNEIIYNITTSSFNSRIKATKYYTPEFNSSISNIEEDLEDIIAAIKKLNSVVFPKNL